MLLELRSAYYESTKENKFTGDRTRQNNQIAKMKIGKKYFVSFMM